MAIAVRGEPVRSWELNVATPKQRVLACPSLPSIPAAALQVLNLTRDPNVQLNDLAKVVKADPGLSTKLLRTVNSSFYSLRERCSRVDRAMGFLGLKAVKNLILGFALVDVTRSVKTDGFDLTNYWRRAMYGAAAARQVASLMKNCDAEEVFTASLLQDIGMLATYSALGGEYIKVLESAPASHLKLCDHEAESLGFHHAEIGAELALRWNLPEQFAHAIRFHHEGQGYSGPHVNLVRSVAFGVFVADSVSVDTPQQALADMLVRSAEWFGDTVSDLEQLLRTVAEAAPELAKVFDTNVGARPDVATLVAQAQEAMLQNQMELQQETDQLRRSKDDFERQTITDALTGAFNRRRFDALGGEAFKSSHTSGVPLSVLFMDGDRFKSVNDTHGHAAGDAVLIELAARLSRTIGERGTVCRFGGEEFAVLLPGVDASGASELADRARLAVCSSPFDLSKVEGAVPSLPVTVSIGVATHQIGSASVPHTQRFESFEALVHAADLGVYAAKAAGRNCVRRHTDAPPAGDASAPGVAASGAKPTAGGVAKPPSKAAQSGPAIPGANVGTHLPAIVIVDDDPLSLRLLTILFQKHKSFGVVAVSADAKAPSLLSRVPSARRVSLIVASCDGPADASARSAVLAAVRGLAQSTGARLILTSRGTSADPSLPAELAPLVVPKSQIAKEIPGWIDRVVPAIAARAAA